MEDLHANLENYSVQLQQVEAALIAEPGSEELKKLKADLEEVIQITNELVQANIVAAEAAGPPEVLPDDPKPVKEWKVGDRCMAIWSKNNQLYEAVIDGISEGKAAVTFVGYNVTEINRLYLLRICDDIQPKKYIWDTKPKGKNQWQMEKERRRKKAQKKAQRLKQMEQEKETEKKKWKDFSSKAFSKSYKGMRKESIFASPDTETGRVGVGTCGISGKPMTRFVSQDKLVTGKLNTPPF
uniref:Tudor domain-containing protein n=1 Tax=Trichuris muris TaxID=70415 RepID=A0A5S6QI58_TRIMR